jgi:transposase
MPVAKVAELTREQDTRIWRVLEHHVRAARDREDFSAVTKVGMDETSARKGQDYVSIVADMMRGRVLFATEGRDAATVARFATDLAEHGGDPKTVTDTSSDMSAAFISGISQHLPNATMTFDRFHLAAKLSEAIDAVRRAEVTTRPELKHTRWLWLKNHASLSAKQQGQLHQLMRPSATLATARALRWREDFPAFYNQDPSYAPEYLRRWCSSAKRSRLQPLKDGSTDVTVGNFDVTLGYYS